MGSTTVATHAVVIGMTVGVVPISLVAGAVCNRAQCAADQGAAPGSSAPAHNATEYGTAHSAPGCTAQTSGAWRRVPIGLFLGEKVTVFGVAIPGGDSDHRRSAAAHRRQPRPGQGLSPRHPWRQGVTNNCCSWPSHSYPVRSTPSWAHVLKMYPCNTRSGRPACPFWVPFKPTFRSSRICPACCPAIVPSSLKRPLRLVSN